MPYRVPPDDFELIAAAALESIPAPLRERMDSDNLIITVQPDATADDRANDIDEHVLGFYEGEDDSVFSGYAYPKRIVLFQRHIERICSTREDLVREVTDTVLHEVAHYFGMNHEDLAQTRLRH